MVQACSETVGADAFCLNGVETIAKVKAIKYGEMKKSRDKHPQKRGEEGLRTDEHDSTSFRWLRADSRPGLARATSG